MRTFVGVILSRWRHLVVVCMTVVLPVSLFAQDVSGAILRANGAGILLNKASAPPSTAVFADDLIETPKGSIARIETTGSAADINSETMVQYEVDELVLDHGSLSVNTTRGLRVRVGCLTVTPLNPSDWTQFEVLDLDGKVTVHALKNDVYIDARSKNPQDLQKPSHSSRDLVRAGEQKSRDEKCGAAYINPADARSGIGAIMNSMTAKLIGAGIVATVTCYVVCRGDDPISPWKP